MRGMLPSRGRMGMGLGLGWTAAAGGGAPAETYHIEIEDSSGDLLLETGDYLLLEDAP